MSEEAENRFFSFASEYSEWLSLILDKVLDKFQSGYHQKHSSETTLPRVSNDIMVATDCGKCTVILLLDLSAAFDAVDKHSPAR